MSSKAANCATQGELLFRFRGSVAVRTPMQFHGLHAVFTRSGPRFSEECAEAIAEIRLGLAVPLRNSGWTIRDGFKRAQTRSGCISRQHEEFLRKRSGLSFRTRPLRLGQSATRQRLVQPPARRANAELQEVEKTSAPKIHATGSIFVLRMFGVWGRRRATQPRSETMLTSKISSTPDLNANCDNSLPEERSTMAIAHLNSGARTEIVRPPKVAVSRILEKPTTARERQF